MKHCMIYSVTQKVDEIFAKLIQASFYIRITMYAHNEVGMEAPKPKKKRQSKIQKSMEQAKRIIMVQRAMMLTNTNYSMVSGMEKG